MRTTALHVFALATVLGLAFGSSSEAAPLKVTGCLEKGDGKDEFKLTNAEGGESKEYELITGGDVDLKGHVGHKVEISGEKATEAEEGGGKAAEKEGKHAHLKVTSMKHLAAECP